jgi:hypothetical protein
MVGAALYLGAAALSFALADAHLDRRVAFLSAPLSTVPTSVMRAADHQHLEDSD